MQHILICPFGWLGKNIMPLPGMDGWRDGDGRGGKSERRGTRGDLEDDSSEGSSPKGMKPVFS